MAETCENGHVGVELQDHTLICGAPQCCPVCCDETMAVDIMPNEQYALTELDGPGNTVFEARDPKPPGVTVVISRIPVDRLEYCWTGRLDGAHWCARTIHAERDADGNPFRTPDAAQADCREQVVELVSRLLPDLEREDITDLVEATLHFVRNDA